MIFISVSKYRDPEVRRCCMAGVKAYPVSDTCRDRAQRIRRNQRCISAFIDCCEFANRLRLEEPNKLLILARMREYRALGAPAEQGEREVMESINPSLIPARVSPDRILPVSQDFGCMSLKRGRRAVLYSVQLSILFTHI